MKVNGLMTLAGAAASLTIATAASAQASLVLDNYAASNEAGSWAVIDLWIEFEGPAQTVNSVFNANISLDGASNWYHASTLGGATWEKAFANNAAGDPTAGFPEYQYDSYVAINSETGTFDPNFVNDPLANNIGENAGWFSTPPNDSGNALFLGRFAIEDGAGAGAVFLNIDSITVSSVLDGETLFWTFEGISEQYIPAPGALALLGLAGLVGTRRRRA